MTKVNPSTDSDKGERSTPLEKVRRWLAAHDDMDDSRLVALGRYFKTGDVADALTYGDLRALVQSETAPTNAARQAPAKLPTAKELRSLFDKEADAFSGSLIDYPERVDRALFRVYEFGRLHGRADTNAATQAQVIVPGAQTGCEPAVAAPSNATTVWGPEKQDYQSGPVYRVGSSTGVNLSEQPAVAAPSAGTPRRDGLLAIKPGMWREWKDADFHDLSTLCGQLERDLTEAQAEASLWRDRADRVIKERDRIGRELAEAQEALGEAGDRILDWRQRALNAEAAQSASASTQGEWRAWADWARAEYRKATGRDLQAESGR